MIDFLTSAAVAIGNGSASAPVLVAVAGAVSGVGPCASIRGAVLCSILSSAGSRKWLTIAAFVSGTVCAYALLALALPLFGVLLERSVWVYLGLGVAMCVSGVRVLCARRHRCEPSAPPSRPGLGGAFAAGVGSSAMLSPCCTPLILCILSLQAQTGHIQTAAVLLGAFAMGHAVPMVLTSAIVVLPLGRLLGWAPCGTMAIVSGALQIGVGLFYAVLA